MAHHEYAWVRLKRKRDQRVRSGHLWIFSNEIEDGFQSLPPGTLVHIQDGEGKPLGTGTCNPHSLISVRILSREVRRIDEEFFENRLKAAWASRVRVLGSDANCCRVFYSESDGLPGLIIDRYNDVFVVQSNTAGVDRLLPKIIQGLQLLFNPRAIVAAQDSPIRALEQIAASRQLIFGELASPVRFKRDGIIFETDLLAGQKTGFYFDQSFNRRLVASFVRSGDRVIDLFCYTGAFGLYALQAGAKPVVFIDSSESAITLARRNVDLNGWTGRATFIQTDVFEWLKDAKDRFDLVILDPPALAKSRAKVPEALRAYRDLNARAMKRLTGASILITASCSGLVQVDSWFGSLRAAAKKVNKSVAILATGTQSPDHPILLTMPETSYLKCAVLRVE